jgi:DNA polymerase elongation subunit (family B)
MNGDLTYHGAGMKSSRLPGIFDSAKDILCDALLSGETELKPILNRLCKLEQYELRDFTLRSTLHKPLKSYKKGSLQSKLGSQLKALGILVEIGTQTEYIKSKDGYVVIQAANSVKEIDREYYLGVIEKLATALGMEMEFKTRQLKTLDQWW